MPTLEKQDRELIRLVNKFKQDDTQTNAHALMNFAQQAEKSSHQTVNDALAFFSIKGFWQGHKTIERQRVIKRLQTLLNECNEWLQPVYTHYTISSYNPHL